MKVISFAIFDNKGDWQFLFYLRGLFFNASMAKIVYPDFVVMIYAERSVYIKYNEFFQQLIKQFGVEIIVRDDENLCKNMLWRMLPIFDEDVQYVFPRDTDSLLTFREAQAVKRFIESGQILHGIHDNPAHSLPLLGGMCGFSCEPLREKYKTHRSMLQTLSVLINKHGSDQDFLNKVVYHDFKDSALLEDNLPIDKNNKLWLSNLCISFIGAAGCNEFETLRYLRDNGTDLAFGGVGEKYPKIFYWL